MNNDWTRTSCSGVISSNPSRVSQTFQQSTVIHNMVFGLVTNQRRDLPDVLKFFSLPNKNDNDLKNAYVCQTYIEPCSVTCTSVRPRIARNFVWSNLNYHRTRTSRYIFSVYSNKVLLQRQEKKKKKIDIRFFSYSTTNTSPMKNVSCYVKISP